MNWGGRRPAGDALGADGRDGREASSEEEAQGEQAQEVEVVKVTDVGIKNFSSKGIEVGIAMQIKNPNNYAISIVGSDLIIFLKGQKLGTAAIKEKIKLNENYYLTTK